MSEQIVPEELYEEGRALLVRGLVEPACQAFCRMLDACPDALDDISAIFGRQTDRRRAIAFLERQVEAKPRVGASGYALAARLARDVGQLDDALRWARQAIAAAPECAVWLFDLGEILLSLRNFREARKIYRKCLAVAPNCILARSRLMACQSHRWDWLARHLARSRLVHRLLRRMAWSGGRLQILEEQGNSVAAHQMRWTQALEEGSALAMFAWPPKELEPQDLTQQMEQQPISFWRWFLQRGIESEIRSVLDVGCGVGFLAEHFVRRGFDVTGVTCSPYERGECLRRGIKVVEADFHFLPLPDARFDLIVSSHSLEHSLSPLFALWEWKRVTRPGGYLLILVPMPLEQDARAVAPEHYDAASDLFHLAPPTDRAPTPEHARADHSAYGLGGHHFVLTYWQLRWLFQLASLDLVADGVEDPTAGTLLGTEHIDGRLPTDPQHPLNGLFLLRRPALSLQDSECNQCLRSQNGGDDLQ